MTDPFDSAAFDKALKPFYTTSVAFFGERAGARPVAFTVECTVIEDSASPTPGEAIAPSRERTFNVNFPRDAWLDVSPPQTGEWLVFTFANTEVAARVSFISHLPDGDYSLTAVWDPKESRGPAWLR